MITKAGARVGDLLVLSKPIGTGVITTAFKRDLAEADDIAEAVNWMKRLNNLLVEMVLDFELHGGTDITGFGLLGHAWELADASGVGLRISFGKIPFLPGAKRYAREWNFPGGSIDNRSFYGQRVRFTVDIEEAFQMLLFDAQTSGGLLLSVPPDKVDILLNQSKEIGQPLWVVGEVVENRGIEVSE
jgi:selenide, water dikinase